MALSQLKRKHGYQVGLFRRGGNRHYFGTSEQLLKEVSAYNKANEGHGCIIIFSMWEAEDDEGNKLGRTEINIGVYGNNLEECKNVLNSFAMPLEE
jgi:hypothetical protein